MSMAKKLGISVVTAVKDVKEAIKKEFIIKKRNFQQVFIKGGKLLSLFYNKKAESSQSPTFITESNAYFIKANTYTIHPSLKHCMAII